MFSPRKLLLLATLALACCRHHAETKLPDGCDAFPVALQPLNIENALVEEDQYRHLVKEVSDEIALGLRDRLSQLHKYQRVEAAAECAAGLRLESRVVSLVHKSRKYHYKVAGRLVECGTDRVLHTFETEQVTKDVAGLADALADDITNELNENVVCRK